MSGRSRWLAPVGVFGILWTSYAYYWQARDWNSSSRLMLTYALADRLTVEITGLEDHTRDRARVGRRYYSDKLPGYSLVAVPPYLLTKHLFRLPDHPVNRPGRGFTHWPADYAITLGTSGLATALTGALLAGWAAALGCGARRAVLIGLAYGVSTPAYAYGTLAYGHQLTSFTLLGSFWLIWSAPGRSRTALRAGLAGFLAALAATVELQVAPVAAVLGSYLVVLAVSGKLPTRSIVAFGLGAVVPLWALAMYNVIAFGSPCDMGYFHEDIAEFSLVHSARNPLGLRVPDASKVVPLLWGRYRGLLFFAPVLGLAPLGWVVLARRRLWGLLGVTLSACVAVFVVNLSYPEWTGGWSTGPRLLVPLLPFAMLPVAAALATNRRIVVGIALILTVLGAALMLLFVGVGGRVPQDVADPLLQFVWPAWSGDPLPPWSEGHRFARNAMSILAPGAIRSLPPGWQWAQFAPLIGFQLAATAILLILCPSPGQPPGNAADG